MPQKLYPNFLIIGMERSGTHWVAGLLNEHQKIAAFPSLPFHPEESGNKVGEVHFFNTLASIYEESPERYTKPISDWRVKYNRVFADLSDRFGEVPKEKFIQMAVNRYSEYCDRQRGEKEIVGEGSPAYVFHLDLIDLLYPGIKKICSIRDPKDKIVSWYMSSQVRKGGVAKPHITEEFALGYLEKRIVKEYEVLLEYNGSVHCITYENMSVDTAETARRMVEYLGYFATDDELACMVEGASFKKKTAQDSGRARAAGEEDAKSGLRKGIVGDWKNHISLALAEKIDKRVAGLREEVFEKYNIKNSPNF